MRRNLSTGAANDRETDRLGHRPYPEHMGQAAAALRGSVADRTIVHQIIAGTARGPGLRMALFNAPNRVPRAVLHPTTAHSVPPTMVSAAVVALRSAGHVGPITTPALTPEEVQGFRQAGFADVSNLLLFRLGLRTLDRRDLPAPAVRLVGLPRRSGPRQAWLSAALAVDHAAFPPGEHFDELSIDEALRATPRRSVRFAIGPSTKGNRNGQPGQVIGYAITGRSGRRSYLQRLAVHPDHAGRGIGATLCADAIRWASAGHASVLAVNTRTDNTRAAALYERMGFEPVPGGLVVLGLAAVEASSAVTTSDETTT